MNIYPPSEDTFLLLKWAKKLAFGKVMEMGAGNGLISEELAKLEKVNEVWAVDVDEEVVEYLKEKFKHNPKVKVIKSNLFSHIPKEIKFDTIIFNPPYLPEEGWEDEKTKLQTVGGKEGNEITIEFLRQARNYLRGNGKILVILCSLSNPKKVLEMAKEFGYCYKKLDTLKLDFEELYVYEFSFSRK